MANGERTRSPKSGKAEAYTTRVFNEFFRLSKDKLEAVKNGLSEAEIPAPPTSKKRGTPVPPAIALQQTPFGE